MVTGAAPSAASHLSKPRVPLSAVIGGGSPPASRWGPCPGDVCFSSETSCSSSRAPRDGDTWTPTPCFPLTEGGPVVSGVQGWGVLGK